MEDVDVTEVDAFYLWNSEFPDATVPQLIAAAILFQDTNYYVPLKDIKEFIEDCLLDKVKFLEKFSGLP